MAKAFFRFLRGELNGYYIKNINQVANTCTQKLKDFLCHFKKQQFILGEIDEDYLYGLGEFAGIFLPRLSRAEALSSIRMTESHEVNDFEFSERGLFDTEYELFRFFHCIEDDVAYFTFVHTTQDDYNTDINTLASSYKRSSLVGDEEALGYISSADTDIFDDEGNVKPEKIRSVPPRWDAYSEFYGDQFLMLSEGDESEADNIVRLHMTDSEEVDGVEYSERGLYVVPISYEDINTLATPTLRSSLVGDEEVIGYISSEATDVIDDNGLVRPEKVLSEPPVGVAYSEYYGDQFLFLSEAKTSYTPLALDLYIELFKAMQWVRYNEPSVTSLVKIVELICPEGLVKIGDIEIAFDKKHINVYYEYNETVEIDFKQQRLSLLDYILQIKFPQVMLVEIQ